MTVAIRTTFRSSVRDFISRYRVSALLWLVTADTLTRALVGSNYKSTLWGGGGGLFLVPIVSPELLGRFTQFKAFDSPGKSVEGKLI